MRKVSIKKSIRSEPPEGMYPATVYQPIVFNQKIAEHKGSMTKGQLIRGARQRRQLPKV